MKKFLSLSVMLSLGLATVTPALNAAQSQAIAQSQANPAHVSGWQAAKKWWRSEPLSRQEKKAFRALKRRFTIQAIILGIFAIIGGGATYGHRRSAGRSAGPSGPTAQAAGPVVAPGKLISAAEEELLEVDKLFITAQNTFKKALDEYIRVVTKEKYTQEERHHPSHYEQKYFKATLSAVRGNKERAFVSAYAEYKKAIKTWQAILDKYPDSDTEQFLKGELSRLESNAITFLKKNNIYRNPDLQYDLSAGRLVSVA